MQGVRLFVVQLGGGRIVNIEVVLGLRISDKYKIVYCLRYDEKDSSLGYIVEI